MRELPEGWIETTLGEIAAINPRESIKKGSVAKSVAMEKLPAFDKRITGFELKPFKGGTKFRNGDTLLARITPCLENGKTAYVDILDEGEVAFGSTEYIVIREKEGLGDKQFLFYLATSPRFREIATKCMTGTSGRQRVQTDVLINKPMFLPPLPEQKAIADMLSSFDEKIELLREQNKTLETLAQTIFKEWFVHFNFPVCQGTGRPDQHGLSACGHAQAGKPYLNNGGAMVASELGLIPQGWRVGKLGEFLKIKSGFAFKSKDFVDSSFKKALKIKDLKGKGKVSIENLSSVDESSTGSKRVQLFKLDAGDIVLAMSGNTTGKIGIVPEHSHSFELYLNQRVGKFFFENIEFKNFTYVFLMSGGFEEKILNMGYGSAQPNINPSQIENIEVVIPDDKTFHGFNRLVEPTFEKMNNNTSQIQSLSKTRDTLLPKLLSGELSIGVTQTELEALA